MEVRLAMDSCSLTHTGTFALLRVLAHATGDAVPADCPAVMTSPSPARQFRDCFRSPSRRDPHNTFVFWRQVLFSKSINKEMNPRDS